MLFIKLNEKDISVCSKKDDSLNKKIYNHKRRGEMDK